MTHEPAEMPSCYRVEALTGDGPHARIRRRLKRLTGFDLLPSDPSSPATANC
ncbi:hypothetical protein [Williamsia sp. 1135]|uniref:hypothetical protein n=1 Tax=Williamsia sp. 1135 TaxID=1889262 RepID=UPI0026C2BA27